MNGLNHIVWMGLTTAPQLTFNSVSVFGNSLEMMRESPLQEANLARAIHGTRFQLAET